MQRGVMKEEALRIPQLHTSEFTLNLEPLVYVIRFIIWE